MEVKKLYKRYLKEIGAYGSPESKCSLEFMEEFSEAYAPFNGFRWDTSAQGELYWFERAVNWLIFLFNNIDNIDDEDNKYGIDKHILKENLKILSDIYMPSEADLKKFGFYDELKNILDNID